MNNRIIKHRQMSILKRLHLIRALFILIVVLGSFALRGDATPLSAAEGNLPANGDFSNGVDLSAQDQKIHGYNFTAYGPNQYDRPFAYKQLDRMAKGGVNSVAITAFNFQASINSTTIYTTENTETDSELRTVIRAAHDRGMTVLLRPLVDIDWNIQQGVFRGTIGANFQNDTQWDAWFSSYEEMINRYATLAAEENVERFSVGTELVAASRHADRWRDVSAGVRERFPNGELTYGANHGNENAIQWWDAVDLIGVDAYYPLTQSNTPTMAQLREAWTVHADRLAALSQQFDRPILFTEVGYSNDNGTNREPYQNILNVPLGVNDLQEQADAFQAMFEVIHAEPWFAGLYVWEWLAIPTTIPASGGRCAVSHSPKYKPAENVLRQWFGAAPLAQLSPSAAGALDIYSESLNPDWDYLNWSWEAHQIDPANEEQTFDGGRAIKVHLKEYGGFSLATVGDPIAADTVDFLRFEIRGDGSGNQQLWLYLNEADRVVCQLYGNDFIEGGSVRSDAWRTVQVPLRDLGLEGVPLKRITIKSPFPNVEPAFWIDNLRLLKADTAPIAPESPTVTPTVTPTASPTATEVQSPTTPSPTISPTLSLTVTPTLTPGPPKNGSVLPADRVIDWARDPGVEGQIDDHMPTNVITVQADGTDSADDTEAFRTAINAVPDGGIIEVPAGTYYLSSYLRLGSGQILRGSGPDETVLQFTQDLVFGIEIGGEYPREPVTILDGSLKAARLTVAQTDRVTAGTYGLITKPGERESQTVKVMAVVPSEAGTLLTLEEPLNFDFASGAQIQPFRAAEYAGIENLRLTVADPSVQIGDMIQLRSAGHSWIRNVESELAFRAHVLTRQTYHCEIRESFFNDATGHHDGKQGYGIDLANSTTGCLVEDNELRLLRHSIVLLGSANGNVVAYNHSRDIRHTNFGEGGPIDIILHGFAARNLIEGNVVERIFVGDAVPVGADNTLVRNCLTSGPLSLGPSVPRRQNLVGNAMFGSDDQLRETIMPPILPHAPEPRPYLSASATLFDEDGIWIANEHNPTPIAFGNWHGGSRWTDGSADALVSPIPDSYYGSTFDPIVTDSVASRWQEECNIPAVTRLNGRSALQRDRAGSADQRVWIPLHLQ